MLDALLTEAYSRGIPRLSVHLEPSANPSDRYRLRGFVPPALPDGIEQWVADFSDDS